MATLSETLQLVKPLLTQDAQKQAYTVFNQCLSHLDNQFCLLYLLDADDSLFADQSVFLGSVYEGQARSWYHNKFDTPNALAFMLEMAQEMEKTDKTQRLCMMVYNMDSTPLTIPNFKSPDYAYLWEIKDGSVQPSAEEFFTYNDNIFETLPGPALIDGKMEFHVPEPDLIARKEKEAARQFATDLANDFFFGIIFTHLPDGIHKVSMATSIGDVAIQLIKSGPDVMFDQTGMHLDTFVSVFSDFIFRDFEFHFLLRASSIADPLPYVLGKPGYELDTLESTLASWKFTGKYISALSAQDTIDFICTTPDGTIITPPKNFSYVDAWVEPNIK